MAISTYGDLRAAFNAYMFHQRFTAQYDDCTRFFEAAANRRLRVRPMETINVIQTATGSAAVPADYLLWRTVLWIRGGIPLSPPAAPYRGTELDYVHPAYLLPDNCSSDSEPRLFTIEGDEFRTNHIPVDPDVAVYELHYYQKIPTITGSDTNTNWLLTAYPDVYLFGVLTELSALGRNLEMAQLYKARRDELFQEIIQLSALTTGASSPSVRTAEYF